MWIWEQEQKLKQERENAKKEKLLKYAEIERENAILKQENAELRNYLKEFNINL